MKKLARRFAIGAMAAMMALSAFSAQAAVAGASGSSPAGIVMPADVNDARVFHSLGYWGEYNEYVSASSSPVKVNAFSGNVYIDLADIPGGLSYNSLGDRNVGFGPNFMSMGFATLEVNEDGSATFYEGSGLITHFKYNSSRNELVDERNWTLNTSGVMYGYMNSKPRMIFDNAGRFYSAAYREMDGSYVTTTKAIRDENGVLTNMNYYYLDEVAYEYYPAAEGEVAQVKSITSDGVKYVLVYNDQGNLLRVETENGDTYLDLDYDATGKLVTRVGSTRIQYDQQGRAVNLKTYKSTGALQDNISFEYGNDTTVITKTNGSTEIMNFDLDGSRVY